MKETKKSVIIPKEEYEGLQKLVLSHSITAFEATRKVEQLAKENKQLKQIICILNKYYSHFHLTGKAVLDMSEETETMSYRDMHILQILLDDTIREVREVRE